MTTRRAMQGGNIEGAPQKKIEAAVKALFAAIHEVVDPLPIPEDHKRKEAASILIQAVMDEVDDGLDFLEGAMTQIGWQAVVRSNASTDVIESILDWFEKGLEAGVQEPIIGKAGEA